MIKLLKNLRNFLASLKLAIFLLILLVLSAAVGTFIPQGGMPEQYLNRFGSFGRLIPVLELHRVYTSAWFTVLLLLFSLNIIFCTLARLGPKLRRFFKLDSSQFQGLDRLKLKAGFRSDLSPEKLLAEARSLLKGRRYQVRSIVSENSVCLQGKKRALGWFGSDFVHLGIVIILSGGIVSSLLAKREFMTLTEGQEALIPGTSIALRLDKFETEFYTQGGIKDWKSTVSVSENGQSAFSRVIEVNHPLSYRSFKIYQSGYGRDWSQAELSLELKKSSDPAFSRTFILKPGQKIPVDDDHISLISARSFVPDFILTESRQVASKSDLPNNPAVFVEVLKGQEKIFSGWLFLHYPGFQSTRAQTEPELLVYFRKLYAPEYSVLEVTRDPGVIFIWIGCLLLSAGLFLAFYWRPVEVRLQAEEIQVGSSVKAAGLSAGNNDRFRVEFDDFIDSLRR